MLNRFVWLSAASLFLGAGAVANVAGLGVEALDQFARDNPRAGLYMTGERVTSVYGPAFSRGASPEASVNAFLAQHSGVFGVTPGELVVGGAERGVAGPIGLMPTDDGFKFTLFQMRHEFDGVPVFRSNLNLLVRNEDQFPLVLARSSLRTVAGFVVDDAVAAAPNVPMAKAVAQANHPHLNTFLEPTLVIFAGDENQAAEPRLAIQFYATTGDVRRSNYDEWFFVCDAATGAILYEEHARYEVDMQGNVSGLATDGPGADFCHAEVATGLPYARVQVGAATVFADAAGDFVVPNVAGGTQTVTASIANGEFFRLIGSANQSVNVAAPGPANILFNAGNTEFPLSEVNSYLHSNVIRDTVLAFSPAYPVLPSHSGPMDVTVNIADTCNAFYSPSGQNINFFRAGGGCPNTGFTSVVYHEYGHHLVNRAGSGQGQYGEGAGDVMSVLLLDDPILGRGWSGSCSSGLRSALNSMQYPCSAGSHACAPLLSSAVWDTRNALAATNPSDYLEIISGLFINSILLHTGSNITPQITIDLITLDDDDADITNGSPHYAQINQGFGAHNMAGPAITALAFVYPDGLPGEVNPSGQTFPVRVSGNLSNTPLQGSAVLHVDDDGDNVFEQYPMQFVSSSGGQQTYNATFPPVDCLAEVRFFVSAATTTNVTVNNPSSAPNASYLAIGASGVTVSFEDNFATDLGWTIGAPGDNATTGVWERVDPVGTEAQPGDDFDGESTFCFVTGQHTTGGVGANDVDGGTTTLISPAMDATGGAAAYISYARWYSNDTGAAANADTFVIDISNDNGATWTNLETVGPAGPEASGGWNFVQFLVEDFVTPTSTVRLRFRASDLGSGSVVEAAVDAVSMDVYECAIIDCPGDLNGDLVVDFGDLNILLGNYNLTGAGLAGDLDGDEDVDFDDLNALLNAYGSAC